jgi:hypothetical protein
MLSQVVSLTRLRLYEGECRRHAAAEPDTELRGDLSKFADSLQRAVRELETILDTIDDGTTHPSMTRENRDLDM